MARIVVGPLLRYVDQTSALVWVETDQPCTVSVLGCSAATFSVHGHHYGVVDVTGLQPGTSTEYAVELDGQRVWPEPRSEFPPPRIRTTVDDFQPRFAFGSCRMSVPHDASHNRTYGVDVLRAYAYRLRGLDDELWPDLLLLLGDQVYADETSPAMREVIGARRDTSVAPGHEVADFEEYTQLYRLAWSDPAVRWLLSTVSSAMIFDDHDIRDDWNTSAVWRQRMADTAWWPSRITGGLAAYWLYQHVGNLSPGDRAADALLAALRAADGDGGEIIDRFARSADRDPSTALWSYARDIAGVRLVMLDTRAGRVLVPGRRAIMDADEWSWVAERLEHLDDVDHLLIGTSLPYLLPRGLHDLEAWNEAVADGRWGRWAARVGEAIRQGIDLEHWAAFGDSFRRMAQTIRTAATGPRAPATITFLSGDVHYSYAARLSFPGSADPGSRIHQLVCSPVRNPLSRLLRYLNGVASFWLVRAVSAALAKAARIPDPGVRWTTQAGPRFDNALATIEFDGEAASARWETASGNGGGSAGLTEIMRISL